MASATVTADPAQTPDRTAAQAQRILAVAPADRVARLITATP